MSRAPNTRKFGEKRDAIVNAASILINDAGVQATTLADVAQAIGLNATSVTYYFPRKEQLVVAVYDETLTLMERMAATMVTSMIVTRATLSVCFAVSSTPQKMVQGTLATCAE